MNWSRIKTVLIIFLAAVNLIFAGNLLFLRYGSKIIENQAVQTALQVLENRKISLNSADIPDNDGLFTLYSERISENEEGIAKPLFGEFNKTELGGGMISFKSTQDELLFRNGSFFELALYSDEGYNKKHINEIIKKCGIKSRDIYKTDENDFFLQRIEDAPVFNGGFGVYSSDEYTLISGRWIFNKSFTKGNKAKNSSEILVDLSDIISDEEGTVISSIDRGWLISTGQNGMSILTPVWKVSCNGGEIYIDITTGKLAVQE